MMQILEACPLGPKGRQVAIIGTKAPKGAVYVDALRFAAAQDAGWIGTPPKPKSKAKKGDES